VTRVSGLASCGVFFRRPPKNSPARDYR
jgi:hypothetical protein